MIPLQEYLKYPLPWFYIFFLHRFHTEELGKGHSVKLLLVPQQKAFPHFHGEGMITQIDPNGGLEGGADV